MCSVSFGQDFVLGLDFVLQELDPLLRLLDLTGGTLLRLEGGDQRNSLFNGELFRGCRFRATWRTVREARAC
jgi:hypothetical protein